MSLLGIGPVDVYVLMWELRGIVLERRLCPFGVGLRLE